MTDPSRLIASLPTELWMGGQQIPSSSNTRFAVVNPATGTTLTTIADATTEDGLRALDLAAQTQPSRAATAPRVRSDILRQAFDLLHDRADDFALLMTL